MTSKSDSQLDAVNMECPDAACDIVSEGVWTMQSYQAVKQCLAAACADS